MSYLEEISGSFTNLTSLSRLQEKEELQHLNDRFLAYVRRIRQLGEHAYNADSSAFLKSAKILEDEIISFKTLYESELQKLRKEIEEGSHERNILLKQNLKHQQCIEELQNRLFMESEKNLNFFNEIKMLQKNKMNLQAEIQNAKLAQERPEAKVEQLYRTVENLTLEGQEWKQRYECETCKRQEAEDKLRQLLKKIEFSDQIQKQQITDYQLRLDTATGSIISLESRISELSKTDVSLAEMFKQIRESTESELKEYQMESEEIYSRNLSVLKAQIDNDADTIKSLTKEKQEIIESISELHAKIRNLEGQLSNLEHQKETLENVLLAERSQAAFNIIQLEKRFRDVQNQLVIQMREVSNAREAKLPLRAEIETLKMLLEEEEQRLNVPLAAMPNSVVQSPLKHSTSTTTTQSPQLMHALLSAISDEQQVSNMPQSFADARKANVLQLSTVPSQNLSSAINTENLISSYGPANSSYLGEPSSVVKTISSHEGLQSGEEKNRNDIRFDQNAQEFSLPITRPNYHYESTPSISRVLVEADKKQISKPIGPIPSRIKSAPVSFERNLQETEDWKKLLKTNKLSQEDFKTSDEDAFKKLFVDFKQETLFPKQRPKSTPPGRSLSSTLEDYNVTTSNSLRDLKIAEVSQDGKYVRLLNDGTTDVEIGGFIIQQNVGGHPVAAFRFPSQTKFQADSTITIWAGINDSQIHYPPHEFYWKELYKWRAGPETTTILCQPNGQAVAWYTAAHRVSKDAYIDNDKSSTNNKSTDKKDIKKDVEEEILTELNKDLANIKSEPIFLKRKKQQPPSLSAAKHPHGHAPNASVHPHMNLQSTSNIRNENYTSDSQTKTQNDHSDPFLDRSNWSTPQKMGSAPLRKLGGNQGPVIPSPFMKPQSRFSVGLAQINSQQELDFLPPMPRPQQTSW